MRLAKSQDGDRGGAKAAEEIMKRFLWIVAASVVTASVARGQARLGLYVVDANGQKVGYYDAGSVVFFVNDVAFSVGAATNGFAPSGLTYFYPTSDCSGTAYIDQPVSFESFFTYVNYTTDSVFHYTPPQAPTGITWASQRDLETDGSLGPCVPSTGSGFFYVPATMAAPSFSIPFRVVDALQVSPAPPVPTFNDVPTTHQFFQFIEALHASGITGGCSVSPPLYCPDNPVTRGQMAVFLAKALGL
jgi:hypothetical protein